MKNKIETPKEDLRPRPQGRFSTVKFISTKFSPGDLSKIYAQIEFFIVINQNEVFLKSLQKFTEKWLVLRELIKRTIVFYQNY